MKNNNLEIRNNGIIIERSYENSRHVEGYAIVFDSQSEYIGFYETIERGAITQDFVNHSDVFALFNHDDSKVLARSNNGIGTLHLTVDDKGLKYEFDAANTQLGNDLLEYLKRGEICSSSFAFAVDPHDPDAESWERKNGETYRTIHKIAFLHDVSPVWDPAYKATSVSQRALDKAKEMEEREQKEAKEAIIKDLDNKLEEIYKQTEGYLPEDKL